MFAGYLALFAETRWGTLDEIPLDSLDAAFLQKAQEIRRRLPAEIRDPAAPVRLNQARAEELEALPGVGPARAQAILALRDSLGEFTRPEQLLLVHGIGPATLARMSKQILLETAATADSSHTLTGREISHGR